MARAAEILAWHPGNRDRRLTAEYVEAKVAVANLLQRASRKPWPLKRRELIVLAARFGLTGPQHTLEETAKLIGVSKERVRQIEWRALNRLRNAAGLLREPEYQPPPQKPKRPLRKPGFDGERWFCIAGELTLDCDGCKAKFYSRLFHKGGVVPLALVDHVRQAARVVGWSTEGGDWCPQCAHAAVYHAEREAQHPA